VKSCVIRVTPKNFGCLSNCRYAQIAPKICQGHPPTFDSQCSKFRRLLCGRLEFSANGPQNFIVDCCNVCQALKDILVWLVGLAHHSEDLALCTNVFVIPSLGSSTSSLLERFDSVGGATATASSPQPANGATYVQGRKKTEGELANPARFTWKSAS